MSASRCLSRLTPLSAASADSTAMLSPFSSSRPRRHSSSSAASSRSIHGAFAASSPVGLEKGRRRFSPRSSHRCCSTEFVSPPAVVSALRAGSTGSARHDDRVVHKGREMKLLGCPARA
ncbi:hypothetical protein AAHA92_15266 [Salvia divinorum]|uniref:Uncharacterized protein n=1 Tax=Salvia divinorum TaxID=28513 RepID=A0ABD1HI63_SALDI